MLMNFSEPKRTITKLKLRCRVANFNKRWGTGLCRWQNGLSVVSAGAELCRPDGVLADSKLANHKRAVYKKPLAKGGMAAFSNEAAPLAQLVEQVTLNHWVAGSIPARCRCYRPKRNDRPFPLPSS
jgi:hypothetical protein